MRLLLRFPDGAITRYSTAVSGRGNKHIGGHGAIEEGAVTRRDEARGLIDAYIAGGRA